MGRIGRTGRSDSTTATTPAAITRAERRCGRPRRRRSGVRAIRPVRRVREGTRAQVALEVVAGASLVARLHLLRLWRSPRRRLLVLAWIASTYLVLGLGWAATGGDAGVLLGLVSFGALTVGLCVAPAVAAAGITADRELGVLPFLQVSGLRAGGLAVGAWCAGLAVPVGVLVATTPALVTAAVLDSGGLAPMAQSLAALGASIGAVCSLAVLSATRARRALAALALAYVGVACLTVGTLVAYALASAGTQETTALPVRVSVATIAANSATTATTTATTKPRPDADGCVVMTQEVTRYRSDRVWGVLALNPYVVLADALAGPPRAVDGESVARATPVTALSATIRATRLPPPDSVVENCPRRVPEPVENSDPGPVWPLGVVALSALTVAGLRAAARDLRTPTDRVGRAPRRRHQLLRR